MMKTKFAELLAVFAITCCDVGDAHPPTPGEPGRPDVVLIVVDEWTNLAGRKEYGELRGSLEAMVLKFQGDKRSAE